MADVVEYILSLKDQFSGVIDGAKSHVTGLEESLGGVGKMVESLGISFAVFKGFESIKEGIEKVEEFHKAEASLKNTMENMGTYSDESYEKMIKGAGALTEKVGFSRTQFINLQAQLQLVGSIGEKEMQRIQLAAANLATKKGMDLASAGEMLAKAVNNPEMMRQLSQKIKIDPAVAEHIKELSEKGQDAAARMALLAEVEGKVGGAAEAAFNADPLARFNQMMGKVQFAVAEGAVDLVVLLKPALEGIGTVVKWLAGEIRGLIKWLKDNKDIVQDVAAAFFAMNVVLAANFLWTTISVSGWTLLGTAMTIYEGITGAVTVAMEFLNATFLASPIGWIVLAVGALAAGVMALVHHFGSFGNAMSAVWEIIKAFGVGVGGVFKGIGEAIWGALTLDPKMIAKGMKDTIDAVKNAGSEIDKVWNNKDAQDAAAKSLVPKEKEKDKKNTTKTTTGDNAPALKTKAEGQKVVNIHIAINGGLVHEMKIMTTNLSQGYGKIKEAVQDVLVGVVNDSQLVASH